jgi:hypothetical protein
MWRRDLGGASSQPRCGLVLTDDHPLSSAHLIARDLLDASECAETVRQVNRLRDHWTMRPDGYFTLGAASYLDGAVSADVYLAMATQKNSVLSAGFNDLYGSLLGLLEHVLGEPATYGECLALPGFHIFEFDGKPSESVQSASTCGSRSIHEGVAKRAHFDLQFDRAIPGWTPEATLSFTLPLAQPSGGSGLAVWPFRYEEAVRRNLPGQHFAAQNPYEQVSYEPGRIILHDGFLLHSILYEIVHQCDSPQQGQRITLQGHGVRSDGSWTIYW